MSHFALRGLYAIVDVTDAAGAGRLIDAALQALAGGAALVQYRNKGGDAQQRTAQARLLLDACNRYHVPLLINDDTELALEVGAHGVHIGQQDTPLALARERLGADAIIGVSCNNRYELAVAAAKSGANYIAFGRFFASRTKPEAPQAEMELIARAKLELQVPIAVIGGITLDNAPALLEAGADMLAVIHGLFGSQGIEATARRFVQLIQSQKIRQGTA
ncbi:MAG: thiamine phosphate synthase [Pseudomonadota bacterium]|nr:MAG: thiamine phosphate synthase [Pseudomonadota bacterium]